MILADIVGGLGNQLFCYAATKAISMDLGYEYRYRVVPPPQANVAKAKYNCEGSFVDKLGQEYNHNFDRIFHIDTSERVERIPSIITKQYVWRRSLASNFDAGAYRNVDNTHFKGFYLHPKYFSHKHQEVRHWFRFRRAYVEECRRKLEKVRKNTGATHIVSLHLRGGLSYRLARQTLDHSYHCRAIHLIKNLFPEEKITFILFSDVPELPARVSKEENGIVHNAGTMFEDLCMMTLCDSHIVVNSTFSWWGAWLADQTRGVVVRPSIWPASKRGQYAPTDMFPDEWLTVEACRERLTLKGLIQRIRDEYSLWIEPCEDYPSWFDHYVRKPLYALRNGS